MNGNPSAAPQPGQAQPSRPQPGQPQSSRALSPAAIAALVVGAFVATLAMMGICGGVLYFGQSRIRDTLEQANVPVPTPQPNWNDWMTQRYLSEIYTSIVDKVVAHEAVIEKLGKPIETDIAAPELFRRVNTGELDVTNEAIEFDIIGSKGRGTVRVVAKGVSRGPIQVQEITVTLDDGSKIEIAPPPEWNVNVR